MNSLEQIRSIFDEGTAGFVLIGMLGIDKRIARLPQFYSRIGFVHEFRPLDPEQVKTLLESRWAPAGVEHPDEQLLPEVIATFASTMPSRCRSRMRTRSNSANAPSNDNRRIARIRRSFRRCSIEDTRTKLSRGRNL
jgi:hypothetical protein